MIFPVLAWALTAFAERGAFVTRVKRFGAPPAPEATACFLALWEVEAGLADFLTAPWTIVLVVLCWCVVFCVVFCVVLWEREAMVVLRERNNQNIFGWGENGVALFSAE